MGKEEQPLRTVMGMPNYGSRCNLREKATGLLAAFIDTYGTKHGHHLPMEDVVSGRIVRSDNPVLYQAIRYFADILEHDYPGFQPESFIRGAHTMYHLLMRRETEVSELEGVQLNEMAGLIEDLKLRLERMERDNVHLKSMYERVSEVGQKLKDKAKSKTRPRHLNITYWSPEDEFSNDIEELQGPSLEDLKRIASKQRKRPRKRS